VTDQLTIGLIHPGAMGSSVGAAARANGHRVVWASANRSSATHQRARAAGLEDVGSLEALCKHSDVLISVCPPDAAVEVAHDVARLAFSGTYVDANAIAPQTMREIASAFGRLPTQVIDGGIIGPPASQAGTTQLYLSGNAAVAFSAHFEQGPLQVTCLEAGVGAASALKMAFAAYTKGSTALLAAIYALARAEGVDHELLKQWEQRMPELPGRLRIGVPSSAVKAWRFVGEMREIAATFEAVGLPERFHRAAAEIYERLAVFKDAADPPGLEAIAERLLDPRA